MDVRGAYDEICRNALAATEAQVVFLSRFDAATGEIRNVAWAGTGQAVVEGGLNAVRQLFPDFDPVTPVVRVDANPWLERGYLRGEAFSTTLVEVGAGTAPRPLLELIARAIGVRYCYQQPLEVDGRIEGALIFYTPVEMDERRRRVCAAFGRQAALTLENARLLDEARRARAELEAVFDATEDSIVLFARDGRIVHANRRAQERMREMVGRQLAGLDELRAAVGKGVAAELPGLVDRALAGENATAVLQTRRGGDEERHLHVHAAPVRDGGADVHGVVVVSRDITDLRRAIVERARFDGAIKTARLVAHELNNKLGYTLGYGTLLQDTLGDAGSAEYLEAVVRGAEEAAATVEKLQRLIRFEETGTPLGFPMLDLEASTSTN